MKIKNALCLLLIGFILTNGLFSNTKKVDAANLETGIKITFIEMPPKQTIIPEDTNGYIPSEDDVLFKKNYAAMGLRETNKRGYLPITGEAVNSILSKWGYLCIIMIFVVILSRRKEDET